MKGWRNAAAATGFAILLLLAIGLPAGAIFGMFGCVVNHSEYARIREADEAAISIGIPVPEKAPFPVKDEATLRRLKEEVLSSPTQERCMCAHGTYVEFRKNGIPLTLVTCCRHCIILSNGNHLENSTLEPMIQLLLAGAKPK